MKDSIKKSKSKISKISIFGISSLIAFGAINVGAGCYFGISNQNHSTSLQDNNSNNIPNQDNHLPNNPIVPPSSQDNNSGLPDNSNPPQPPVNPPDGSDQVQPPTPPVVNPDEGGQVIPPPNPPVDPPKPPALPPDNVTPSNMMTFRINVKRSSGLQFKSYDPYFNIYNADTNELVVKNICDADVGDWDGIITVKLPDDANYVIKVDDTMIGGGPGKLLVSTYEFPESVPFNKSNPEVDYIFTPIIVDTPKEGKYRFDDVAHELPYGTDATGRPVSLKLNEQQGKMTIVMYMKTTCQYSIRTLNALNKAIGYSADLTEETPWMWDKVQIICISDVDSQERLAEFTNEYPHFSFVSDHSNKIKENFFGNVSGYPKLAILDYQAVYVQKTSGEIKQDAAGTNLNMIRNWVNRYSKGA